MTQFRKQYCSSLVPKSFFYSVILPFLRVSFPFATATGCAATISPCAADHGRVTHLCLLEFETWQIRPLGHHGRLCQSLEWKILLITLFRLPLTNCKFFKHTHKKKFVLMNPNSCKAWRKVSKEWINVWTIFFALIRRASFWPPSMFYISFIITHILQITFLHDVDLLWAGISTICQSAEYIFELYIRIQIQINQLLIFIKKFSPLLGFEPHTYQVPSRCATNWAIQAWIVYTSTEQNCQRKTRLV